MNKIKNITNKLVFLVVCILLTFILLLTIATNNKVLACTSDEKLSSSETIAHNRAHIDEDFEDDNVIVVLNPKISKINKIHNAKYFDGIEIESIIDLTKREHNFKSKNKDFKQILQIHLKEKGKENVLKAIAYLEQLDGVFSAEPNYFFEIAIDSDDPEYINDNLWGLNGTNGINASTAWNLTRGNNTIRVGIIDTGIANHIDLNANLVSGRDTFNNNNITNDDTHSHGTHVAGTIGAVGGNGIGVVGVNWNVSLVPLQAANTDNRFAATNVVSAIEWAQDRWDTDERISVINYSVGGFGNTTAVRTAISEYNGLFVWAAGNETADIDERVRINGSFNLDNLISVGALNSNGTRRSSSNYSTNNTNVHIYAPGTNIYSTVPTWFSSSGYAYKSGTSMAAPHVAGTAALMLSVNPNMTGGTGSTLGARLKHALVNNADTISITIPNGSGGTIAQNVRKLNTFKAISAVTFTTSSNDDGISIDGFINGYNLPNNTNLVLPEQFAPLGDNQKNIITIGANAFKGCASLTTITIPNSVTNIDSSAFENCTYLQSVTLSSNLNSIGNAVFKGCTSLSSITIPNSVTNIDDDAFRNCSSLSYVAVQKETSPITNLGQNVFTGCDSNLEINVPINRLIEYKNKEYWSSYRNKITSVGTFEEINIDCETSSSVNYNLQQGLNKCYKINVDCVKSYRISVISNNDVSIKLYNENMIFVNGNTNMLDEYLNVGTYYVLFEYENIELNGSINVDFSLRWPNNFIQIGYNVDTNILSNIHNTAINTKHGKICYFNDQGEGLYKITLNAGNITYPAESLKIYTDSNRTNLLDRYNNPEETTYAISQANENVLFVYLPSNGYYYIDVVLPSNNYSLVKLKIEKAEANNIDYSSALTNIGFDVLFEVNSSFSNFEEVTISHKSKIQLDIVTNGNISQNIKVVVLQKLKEPGYEPGDNHYYNVIKFEDYITATNRSPVFDIIFDSGTYYIGFINNSNHVSISMALRRLVNQEVAMDNTLVADPAVNEGFTLGSEVTVNNGMYNSDTITEGFTRCIYLMVENRLRDPMSRLDYDWYSSNDNVAIVTAYGTVIAQSVNVDTEVTIYAVLKNDPSIVYRKTFIIVNDTKTYETAPLDYYLTMTIEVRENKLINLSSLNVPIDMTQYYNWSSSSLLNINYWGYIYAEPTAQGMTFEVVGTYRLNSRVRIHITVYVN